MESAGNLISGNDIGGFQGIYSTVFGNGMGGVLFSTGANTNTLADNDRTELASSQSVNARRGRVSQNG